MKNFESNLNTAENNSENLESSDWRERKESAPDEASELVQKLNLETLTLDEQIDALKKLLKDIESDNGNRFVYSIVSLVLEERMLDRSYNAQKSSYKNALAQHGMTV